MMSPPSQIPALMQRALEHVQNGVPGQAAPLLLQVLDTQPRHFDALHILGVVCAMQGRPGEAIAHFRKALSSNKNHAFLQLNLAKALVDTDQPADALMHFKRATDLAPQLLDAWLGHGHALSACQRATDALAVYERAIHKLPHSPELWNNQGLVLIQLRRYEAALDVLNRALAINPQLPEGHYNRGIALDALERYEEALSSFACALRLRPDYVQAWNNQGTTLLTVDRYDEALHSLHEALRLQPGFVPALNNLGSAYRSLGRDADAITSYEQVIAQDPQHADAQLTLGHLLIAQQKYSTGWEKLEFRWRSLEDPPLPLPTRAPTWQGQASTQPLLLWGEQGIGDQILYASILPELAQLPQKKYVALDKRLIPLFARSMPGFEFVDLATVSDALGFAEQLPLGSLPRFFRPDLASFSNARHPYLQADTARSAELRHKTARKDRLVCGVSWASKRQKLGPYKSLSLEQMLLPLTSPRLHFVDLQYGDTAAERQALQEAHGVEVQHLDEIDNFHDIDGLAALIQACDVVITTSNSTAHLAGALGKTTLLLLPSGKGQLWYWAEIDGHIPWYPSIRAYRQATPDEWAGAFSRLLADLKKMKAAPAR